MTSSPDKLTLRREMSKVGGSMRDELALLDSAHGAIAADEPARALELARCYVSRYPMGAFRREADALCIHALVMLGRSGEAGQLAALFAAKHGSSPLANRLRRMAE